MKPVLIGSRALQVHTDLEVKSDADWDVISQAKIEGTEWHKHSFLNNAEMARSYHSDKTVFLPDGTEAVVMSMEGLAIIKRSHLWRDLSFQKHITHYHKYMSNYFEPNGHYHNRLWLTKKAFPQGHPNLNQKKEDFFEDAVKKKYDHDWLHEQFAYYAEPLYKALQTDSDSAWCHGSLWDEFSVTDKIRCVAEEAYVIATERFLVPNDWNYPHKKAFFKAVDKICTTLCSGWFRDFAIDHYHEVLKEFDKVKFDAVEYTINERPHTIVYYGDSQND